MRRSQPSTVKNLLKILRLSMISLKAAKFSTRHTNDFPPLDDRGARSVSAAGSGASGRTCRRQPKATRAGHQRFVGSTTENVRVRSATRTGELFVCAAARRVGWLCWMVVFVCAAARR
eukprot:2446555-Pyramimonas_sp.AAC.2